VLLELTVAEQRFNAVMEVLRDGLAVTEVADRYGVSRQTVHGWLRRWKVGGLEALADRSHRPRRCPHQMSAQVEARLCELRRRHPHMSFSSAHVGSLGGLLAVQRGEAHLAGSHLLDEDTGEYNRGYIRRLLTDHPLAVQAQRRIRRQGRRLEGAKTARLPDVAPGASRTGRRTRTPRAPSAKIFIAPNSIKGVTIPRLYPNVCISETTS
jgi:transposase